MAPWALVLTLSWLLNKWQLLFRPLGGYVWWLVDQLDQRAPSMVEVLLWVQGTLSLALHMVTLGINLGVIWVRGGGGGAGRGGAPSGKVWGGGGGGGWGSPATTMSRGPWGSGYGEGG